MAAYRNSSGPPRRGVILLVVVLMLALFLVVGLSFVLYAESEATASRIYREVPADKADVPPEQLLAWALGQLIYPVPDDASGALSALRGHELARTMDGWNYVTVPNTLQVDPARTNNPWWDPNADPAKIPYGNFANTTPFNGLGPLRFTQYAKDAAGNPIVAQPLLPLLPVIASNNPPNFFSDYDLVNYTWYPADGAVRDPEHPARSATDFRADATQPFVVDPTKPALNKAPFAGGFNAPYTYPDRANMVLAAIQTNEAVPNPLNSPLPPQPLSPPRLIMQSLFRPTAYLPYRNSIPNSPPQNSLQIDPTTAGGQLFWNAPPASANPAWKYLVLRPRPGDQLTASEIAQGAFLYQDPADSRWKVGITSGGTTIPLRLAFPPPADAGGDVKQLPGVPLYVKDINPQVAYPNNFAPVQYDSFWMDLNFPVQTTASGLKYKPLFAFLVVDLDGRANLNVHGNTALVASVLDNKGNPTWIGDQQNWIDRLHGSNQGLSRHEVNLSKILSAPAAFDANGNPINHPNTGKPIMEWAKLFTGAPSPATGSIAPPAIPGRYGADLTLVNGVPTALPAQPSTRTNVAPYHLEPAPKPGVLLDPYYPDPANPTPTGPNTPARPTLADLRHSLAFPFDFDTGAGPSNARQPTVRFNMPFQNFGSFPSFNATQAGSYDNCGCSFNAATGAVTNDPVTNNPLLNSILARGAADVVFADENMFQILAGDYRKSYLYGLIPNNLGGDGMNPNPAVNANLTVLGNKIRQLVTTRSFDLDAPGAPPWVTSSNLLASGYRLLPGAPYPIGAPPLPTQPDQINPVIMPTPLPGQLGAAAAAAAATGDYSDFKANDGRANLLGRIDLGRSLTGYADPNSGQFNYVDPKTGQPVPPPAVYPDGLPILPLNPAKLITFPLSQFPQLRYYYALYDRIQFAQDILDRLIQATGALTVGQLRALPKAGPQLQTSVAQYAATRYLAQLAVNMVDYIDDDEVITTFQWNPTPDAVLETGDANAKQMPRTAGWVFGTEAPKVVVNEAYGELQNDPQDRNSATQGATHPYKYSFWLELYNPLSADIPAGTAPGTPPQASRQDPDRFSMNTAGKAIDPATSAALPAGVPAVKHDRMAAQLERVSADTAVGRYPVYEIAIVDEEATQVQKTLSQPYNTDGWFDDNISTKAVKILLKSFAFGGGAYRPDKADPNRGYFDANFVEPSTGVFSTDLATQPKNQGFYIAAPNAQYDFFTEGGEQKVVPTLRTGPPNQAIGGTAQDSLTYEASAAPDTSKLAVQGKDFNTGKHHTVMVRRLACPGLDPNPLVSDPNSKSFGQPVNPAKPFNPYITVDYLTSVPTNDAVKYIRTDRADKTNPNYNNNFKDPSRRRSLARRQPHAADLTGLTPTSVPAPKPVAATFFQHNDVNTQLSPSPRLDAPFDWPVHLDRAPATVTEILHVPATAPHLLTQKFVVGNYDIPQDIQNRKLQAEARDQHLAPWHDQNARLYRALEFFTVGDRTPYPGTGGRVPGKVNPNTIFDRDLLDATIDAREKANPQPSNFFYENPAAAGPPATPPTGAVTDVWQGPVDPNKNLPQRLADPSNVSVRNRKQQMLFGPQTAQLPDRPFMSLAAPPHVQVPTGDPRYDPQYPLGSGLADTILPYPDATPNSIQGMTGTFTPLKALDTSANPPKPVWPSNNYGPIFTPKSYTTPQTPPATTAPYDYTYVQPPLAPNYSQPGAPPLQPNQFQLIPPYVMNELLNKISGHVTPRSNTFAVFLTVGFFEVVDDTTLPVKLGAEVTTANGKAIRHQMFSVVDRTNLAIDAAKALDPVNPDPTGRLRQAATPPVFMTLADAIPAGAGAPPTAGKPAAPLAVNIAGGIPVGADGVTPMLSYDGITPVPLKPYQPPPAAPSPGYPYFWRSGAQLVIGNSPPPNTPVPTYWTPGTCQWMFLGTGATQEPVQVTLTQPIQRKNAAGQTVIEYQLQLLFPNGAQFSHPPGDMLCTAQPGNPGPQGPIDYTSPQYKAVVPYAYIVQ